MKKAFTLIELIATIVILGVVTSIVSILIMNVIRNVKDSANKRSIDNYGRIIETSMAEYQSQYLKYPDSIDQLEIEYVGSVIECETRRINPDKTIYLSECKVNGKKVLDKSTEDGYYHYGTLVLTNEEYVDKLGNNIEVALKDYYEENNKYPVNYRLLELPKLDKDVNCVSEIHQDGTVYLTKCSIDGSYIINENEEDGYYHYGSIVNSPSAADDLLEKANPVTVTNYTDGNTKEMYTFEHPATTQTGALTDYRYIGANPNNYVTFNNELWRIIGVFTVEDGNGNTEQRIKIIRNEKLSSDMAWDSNNSVNEWSTATLNTYLNGDYYNALDDTSKSMIANAKYYLGGSSAYDNLKGEDYYNFERGTTVYSGRSISWTGKIALMYPSDYSYTYALGVDNTCYTDGYDCDGSSGKTNGWIYNTNRNFNQWLLSPYSDSSNSAFYLGGSGSVRSSYSLYSNGIRPSLYLVSNIKIDSGDGSEQSPYSLKL